MTEHRTTLLRAAVACGAVLLPGCLGGTEDDRASQTAKETAVGTAQQAFSGGWFETLSNVAGENAYRDLGSFDDKSCFLSGVGGNLDHGSVHIGVRYFFGTPTNMAISIYVPDTSTASIKVQGMCVNSVAGRTQQRTWYGVNSNGVQNPPLVLEPVAPNRRCFLNGVEGMSDGFGSSTDEVKVWSDGQSWFLGGKGRVRGNASCITLGYSFSEFSSFDQSFTAFQYNDKVPGTQCFLTKVRGRYRGPTAGYGAFISYDAPSAWYYLKTYDGLGATARCVE